MGWHRLTMVEIHDVLAYCSINLVKASAMASAAAAVEAKDWSKLVDIVLRGESELLVDKKSDDTEVQEFLNNAAVFKIKITNIHEGNKTPLYSNWRNHVTATVSGSLKDLQAHLDRRKFCLARDKGTDVNILQKAIMLGHHTISR